MDCTLHLIENVVSDNALRVVERDGHITNRAMFEKAERWKPSQIVLQITFFRLTQSRLTDFFSNIHWTK